jgi:hypothetical protein
MSYKSVPQKKGEIPEASAFENTTTVRIYVW